MANKRKHDMKNAILECINLHKLRQDYWTKIQKWDDLKKEKEADSKKHNGYIDRPHYAHLSRRTEAARMECAAIYEFIEKYFFVAQIIVKRGKYTFTHEDQKYTLKKMETEEYFGWRKGKSTHWVVDCEDANAPLAGLTGDTKADLIDWVNHRIKTKFINDIIGPNPQNS
jgi:hypothetical protein